ncbi:MAG TPA: hypothetical protein VHO46_02135 [Bacteroidales bacterium]|nr:hypothetical protein [Bacteroidales bacterium]
MKRPVLILFLSCSILCLRVADAGAQLWKMRRFEVSAGVGPSFFFGDIGGFSRGDNILGFKDLSFLQTRYNLNVSMKYRVLEDLNVRFSMSMANLKANDSRGSNEGRKIESSISLLEPALIGEFYFIKNKNENSYLFSRGQAGFRRFVNSLDVYAFTGFGGASYSVKGNEKLESLATEKSGFTTVIPIGAGANFIFSPDVDFGVELGGRFTFSDYLDGYTSQYSSANDVYYFLNFTFTYKMRTGSNGWPTLKKSRAGRF